MRDNRFYLLVLVLLTAPFYLNDFANIYLADWRLWLLVDYTAAKLWPLLLVAWLLRGRMVRAADLGLRGQPLGAFVATFVGVTIVTTLIDQNAYQLLAPWPGYRALGSMPVIASPLWNWLDLTVGLLLVGICEELVFRGYLLFWLQRHTDNAVIIVSVSSLSFGLIHWSLGLHAVVITAIISAIFMLVYLRTRSLPAIMLAHFTLNFIDFGGVFPKVLLRFF